MAVNTSPIFIKAGFGGPVAISGSNNDLSGATATNLSTVVTAGTDGAIVKGIYFQARGTVIRTMLNVFHNSGGTRRLVGQLAVIPDGSGGAPTAETPAWSGTWVNPNPGPLAAGDKFDVGAFSGNASFNAWPLGGQLS